jgi:hypothetical protein
MEFTSRSHSMRLTYRHQREIQEHRLQHESGDKQCDDANVSDFDGLPIPQVEEYGVQHSCVCEPCSLRTSDRSCVLADITIPYADAWSTNARSPHHEYGAFSPVVANSELHPDYTQQAVSVNLTPCPSTAMHVPGVFATLLRVQRYQRAFSYVRPGEA